MALALLCASACSRELPLASQQPTAVDAGAARSLSDNSSQTSAVDGSADGSLVAADPRLAAPADVAAAPPDATRTKSGLAYKTLRAGHGRTRPKLNDTVEVAFTGWTSQGEMFNTTVGRPRPAELPMAELIPAWREALRAMVAGEQRRLWVPEDLAMQGRAGLPPGLLVFDLELLEIESEAEEREEREREHGTEKKSAATRAKR
jgi:FKBP-type peptidyl-prolyl cis-trans isomerase